MREWETYSKKTKNTMMRRRNGFRKKKVVKNEFDSDCVSLI